MPRFWADQRWEDVWIPTTAETRELFASLTASWLRPYRRVARVPLQHTVTMSLPPRRRVRRRPVEPWWANKWTTPKVIME
jgi:hypothetical protein